jgi:hypothetical protein
MIQNGMKESITGFLITIGNSGISSGNFISDADMDFHLNRYGDFVAGILKLLCHGLNF